MKTFVVFGLLILALTTSASLHAARISFSRPAWSKEEARYSWLRPTLWIRASAITTSLWLALFTALWAVSLFMGRPAETKTAILVWQLELKTVIVPFAAAIADYLGIVTLLILGHWFKAEAKRISGELNSLSRLLVPLFLSLSLPLATYRLFAMHYYIWYTDYHTAMFQAFLYEKAGIQPVLELIFLVVAITSLVRLFRVRDIALPQAYTWLFRLHLLSILRRILQFWALAYVDSYDSTMSALAILMPIGASWLLIASVLISIRILGKTQGLSPVQLAM